MSMRADDHPDGPDAGGPPAVRNLPAPRQSGGGMLSSVQSSYVDFLPDSQAVVARRHSPIATLLIAVVAFFFILFVLWASFAAVEQSVLAQGQVRPVGRVKVINHPEGGRVEQLHVKEGSRVVAGDLILELDNAQLEKELVGLRAQYFSLAAEVARLEAEVFERDTIDFPPGVKPDLQMIQSQLFFARRDALRAQRQVAQKSLEEAESQLVGLQATLRYQASGLETLQEQLDAIQALVDKEYFPRLRYLSVKRQVNDLKGEIEANRANLRAARARRDEARNQLDAVVNEGSSNRLLDLTARRAERDNIAAQASSLEERIDRLNILVPDLDGHSGRVQRLQIANVGQAVRPGEPIMNIVPIGDEVHIETKVAESDIGDVHLGQEASVKVRAYDFIKYGELHGTVLEIADDADVDERSGDVTYRVVVTTDKAFLGDNPDQQPIIAGMLADVEFRTGEKTVMAFLTDRIFSTLENSFKQ